MSFFLLCLKCASFCYCSNSWKMITFIKAQKIFHFSSKVFTHVWSKIFPLFIVWVILLSLCQLSWTNTNSVLVSVTCWLPFYICRVLYFMINSIMQIVEKAYGEDGRLQQPKELSINKVGHGKITPKYYICILL